MRALGLLFVMIAGAATATPLAAELSVSFEEVGVRVSGANPGGTVALLAIAKASSIYWSHRRSVSELLEDADHDGAVHYAYGSAIPPRSVWAFIDVTSGDLQVATPAEGILRPTVFPLETSLVADTDGELMLVDDRRVELEVLFVRPGVGAWHAAATDGAAGDAAADPDGRVQLRLPELGELGGRGRRLESVGAGDLVVGVDPHEGRFFVHRVGGTS